MPTEQYNLENTSAADRPAAVADFMEPKAFDREPETPGGDGAYWLERIEALIERYPWPTVIVALGVGYVIARRMR